MPKLHRDDDARLHKRLVDGDPLATTEIVQAYGEALLRALRRSMPRPEEELHDATVEAMMKLFGRPELYDPSKGRLLSFLVAIAKHELLDKLRSRRREQKRAVEYGNVVELRRGVPFTIAEMRSDVKMVVLPNLAAVVPKEDWSALELIVDGERSTEVLAAAWGLSPTLSVAERQGEVKRRRDRVEKALQRFGKKLAKSPRKDSDEDDS
jgi:RNA polymerase sigma-70 factor (ECF subfamily)